MWRHVASNALSMFVVILMLLGGMIAWGKKQYVDVGPLAQTICLKVETGSNFNRVSKNLVESGAITNASIFRIGVEYSGKMPFLKAGSFLVNEQASMAEIVDIVTRGGASTCGSEIVFRVGILRSQIQVRELDPQTQRFVVQAEFTPGEGEAPADYIRLRDEAGTRYRIALAEGATSWQIVDALNKAEFLTGTVGEVPGEGLLAPDSYEVLPGADRNELLARMISAQEVRLATAWANRADGLPYANPEEALIMASIVEKETGLADERAQVASVFVNRLNRGMKLQTDPTVIYGITLGHGALGRGLRQSELRSDTPFNTYVIAGLPPTPIANPGLDAIEATLHPAVTDFIFFVANGTGGHAFAATLAEHNRNVAAWRAIESQRAGQ